MDAQAPSASRFSPSDSCFQVPRSLRLSGYRTTLSISAPAQGKELSRKASTETLARAFLSQVPS